MLVFTEEQMVRADAKARVHFHRRVRDHVREKMPEETSTMPNTRLLTYICEQDKIAAEHGIQTERGVTKGLSINKLTIFAIQAVLLCNSKEEIYL